MKLLLHACCGPCSLEPVRLLQQAGHDMTIAFINSNIHPAAEYKHRLTTLQAWASEENIAVIEGDYNPLAWKGRVGAIASDPASTREDRCRACYRMRFQEAACFAQENGFEALSTTLSVSPFQYTETIREELESAGRSQGLTTLFEDFRPYYDKASYRSRSLGMYRQNYCGCSFSQAEAEAERALRKQSREIERAAKRAACAEQHAAEEAARVARRNEREAYANKQAAKRRALKALRETRKEGTTDHENQ